jgi:hypothetical protein
MGILNRFNMADANAQFTPLSAGAETFPAKFDGNALASGI